MPATLSGQPPADAAELEELRRENARLRGDLLAVARRISHDLRTPLGGIISSGEALQEILAETDPGSLPLAGSVLHSAEEIAQLIKRVGFVLKATALPVVAQATPMGEAVAAAGQRLESKIKKTGATVAEPDSWPQVKGVSAWLEVVWWNLLANALQHAGPAPAIVLGWSQKNGMFQFWISDRGPGVAEGRHRGLFHPFHRLHESEAAHGLGLSIVQRLVELQGGRCGYRANPEGGSCFFFELPDNL